MSNNKLKLKSESRVARQYECLSVYLTVNLLCLVLSHVVNPKSNDIDDLKRCVVVLVLRSCFFLLFKPIQLVQTVNRSPREKHHLTQTLARPVELVCYSIGGVAV